MITLVLAAQLAVAGARDTAQYSSPAVRELVTAAARLNHLVPPGLGRYRAQVESEISIGSRNGAGEEASVSIEQAASALTWNRTGEFEQHVTGYRNQSLGFQFSSLGFFRSAWLVPSLYGNRLALLFGRDTAQRRARPGTRGSTTYAVHPLADDRERYYRYSGGDTIEALRVGDREVRIIRLDVLPRADVGPGVTIFTGEIDLDADRMHVVRMRGAFQTAMPARPVLTRMVSFVSRFEAIAYVELVNSEVNQQFWLPSHQRFEGQAMAPVFGDAKAVFRIVSHFRDYDIEPPEAVQLARADTLRAQAHRLTVAARDSLASFGDWRTPMGEATARVNSEDFTDVAPLKWRTTGAPTWTFQGERLSDLVRFNRVEGLFTGGGVGVRARDAAPGLTAHAVAGYAWSEHAVRGRVSADVQRGKWTYGIRAGRSLDNTNDFRFAFDSSGSTIGALFGADDLDYVDRYYAHGAVTRTTAGRRALVRAELGYADDRAVAPHLTSGPLGGEPFRPNRPVDQGGYARTSLTFRWNPDVAAEFVRPGVSGAASYLRGDGSLNFQRAELRLSVRSNPGRWTFASRFDAGAILGPDRPQQQLFEVGSTQNLPGYEYKEFAGDQAAVLRGMAMYRLDVMQAPVRLTRRLWLPAIAPALGVTAQAGWTGASGGKARAAVAGLASGSTVTGGARSSVAAGIRFMGGAVGLMAARTMDHPAPWSVRFEFGQVF